MPLLGCIVPPPPRKYGGHYAVTRSLVEGFTKIGYDSFNYQPKKESMIKENVHVLAGVETLKYAIGLKRKGKIKRLTAGPNIVVFSDDNNSIICDENVDLFCQPSDWARDCHIDVSPSLAGRCVSWPAGVDTEFFRPTLSFWEKYSGGRKHVLLYHKAESDQFCWRLDYLLRKHGFTTHILKYGHYNIDEFKALLGLCTFMAVLARQESQGIYLAEAWSMDVPTIVFDPRYFMFRHHDGYLEMAGNISYAPYLTEKTGRAFVELSELENILEDRNNIASTINPRQWVLENMSDKVCARKFIETVMGQAD